MGSSMGTHEGLVANLDFDLKLCSIKLKNIRQFLRNDLLLSVMIWINLEPCGLICGMMTWLLLGYGMLATTVSAL